MPAGLKFHPQSITLLLSVTVMLLSACSRDNPLSIPDAYIEQPEALCIDDGPYSYFTLLESIDITNTIDNLPDGYPFGYNGSQISLKAPFLIDKSRITPKAITSINPVNGALVVTETVEKVELDQLLAEFVEDLERVGKYSPEVEAQLELINQFPEIETMSVTVKYQNGESLASDVIDDELLFVTPALKYGLNPISIKVTASIRVPRTFVDCENPITPDDLIAEDIADDDKTKIVSYTQVFPIEITRNELDSFISSELISSFNRSENDQIGKVISVSDDFLAIGSPNEDSDSTGITLASGTLDQNENSQNSGAVYVFQKDTEDNWQFHSFIKSSNSEAGDLFGSAVSLYGNTLVVSALGESSIASGVHLSANSSTTSLKLNNTAANSGAVYIFEFANTLNTWSETHYIKPEQNTISDANYNKGFGSQLSIYENKLLVSAPLEDSDNGNSANSNQPDSGAVYAYKKNQNSWAAGPVLKALFPGEGDMFGSSLAINENFIIIGSPFDDQNNVNILNNIEETDDADLEKYNNNNRSDSGSAYIYSHSLSNDAITLSALIKSSNSNMFDYFGSSLAISGNRLFIGAIGEDSSGKGLNRDMHKNDLIDSGAVYMFEFDEERSLWEESAFIKADESQAASSFGQYLTVNGDNLFISSPFFDANNLLNAGKVYSYDLSDSLIRQELLFQAEGTSEEMRFGSQIVTFGRHFVIGASGYINNDSGVPEGFVGKAFTYE